MAHCLVTFEITSTTQSILLIHNSSLLQGIIWRIISGWGYISDPHYCTCYVHVSALARSHAPSTKLKPVLENVGYFNQCGGVMGWCGFELSFAKRKTSSLTKRICVPIEEPGDVAHPRFKSQGARLWSQIGPFSYKEPHVMYNGWIKKKEE